MSLKSKLQSIFKDTFGTKIYICQGEEDMFESKIKYYLIKQTFLSVSAWRTDIRSNSRISARTNDMTVTHKYDNIKDVFNAVDNWRRLHRLGRNPTKVDLLHLIGDWTDNSHWMKLKSNQPFQKEIVIDDYPDIKHKFLLRDGITIDEFINENAEYFV